MGLRACLSVFVVLGLVSVSAAMRVHAQEKSGDIPVTATKTVTDDYHGTTVSEDFRWLEDGQSSVVQKWSDRQNGHARSILDSLPGVPKLRQQVSQILSARTVGYGNVALRGGKCFAIKREPPRQQPFIVVMNSVNDVSDARIVVDPNKLDSSGTTSIDWYKVSPDRKWLAVSLSSGGSEVGNLMLYDVETGKAIASDRIDYVNSGTAGGSLAWFPDSSGFFYTRHFKVAPENPDDLNVYQHVYRHELGEASASDVYELGKGFPQIAEIQLVLNEQTGDLLATVQKGDGGEFAHYLRRSNGHWRKFSRFGDGIKQAVFGNQNDLFVVTLNDAPKGKIVRVPVSTLDVQNSPTLIAEGKDTIVTSGVAFWGETTILPMQDRLYVVYQLGGPSELRCFDYKGRPLPAPGQLKVAAIHGLQAISKESVLFGNTSYTEPDAYYRYDVGTGKTMKTQIANVSATTMDGARVIRKFATSADGTKIPLNIILPPGVTPDESNACLVYGYGGYGVNLEPRFKPLNRILMDYKVIYVVANLRGGGEYGEQWHLEGNLTNKQNVFDDFAACVKYMSANGYTTSERTGILGGSNGGLLMGAALTQHPDMVKAVVSLVGIYDMLRVELSPNGAFNVTEFGTVKNKDQFKALFGYSPYHNVQNGVDYPAVLFMTGENDPRVDPMQSRKMTARLQQATTADAPILLRTSANAGHGSGNSLSEQIEQSVDLYAFLFSYLQVD
ncbi:prolyl oligopeptidase family serine peptidase [bacterium]|nr:prolyl oligopeptidase family serine peptidase [bacterium]